jgi:hypothetical protein
MGLMNKLVHMVPIVCYLSTIDSTKKYRNLQISYFVVYM